MDHSLLILVLLGLAAALMPWQFALEVYLFGEEKGAEKAAAFVGGMMFFRVLLIFVIGDALCRADGRYKRENSRCGGVCSIIVVVPGP